MNMPLRRIQKTAHETFRSFFPGPAQGDAPWPHPANDGLSQASPARRERHAPRLARRRARLPPAAPARHAPEAARRCAGQLPGAALRRFSRALLYRLGCGHRGVFFPRGQIDLPGARTQKKAVAHRLRPGQGTGEGRPPVAKRHDFAQKNDARDGPGGVCTFMRQIFSTRCGPADASGPHQATPLGHAPAAKPQA